MASNRMLLKIAQIARMRLAGVKDVAILRSLGLTQSGFSRIIRTTFYQEHEQALLEGQISKMDEILAQKRDLMKHQWEGPYVSAAQRTIIEVATQRRDLRSALSAAKEILDRDPARTFCRTADAVQLPAAGIQLPASLFEAIARDADGVTASVQQRMAKPLDKADA